MLLSFFKKKDTTSSKLYPSFTRRIFAVILDLFIFSIVLVPTTHIISGFIYEGNPPSKELGNIMQAAMKDATTFDMVSKNMNSNPEYIEFMSERGYSSAIMEQSLQMILLGALILAFWLKLQSTPGKMLLSMKIVDANDFSRKPSSMQLIRRLFGYIISVLPFGLGLFYIIFNKKREAWHDLFSNTTVISEKYYLQHVKGK